MSSEEALMNINIDKIENLTDYFCFCKYYFKPKRELFKYLKKNKSLDTLKDFPFKFLKDFIVNKEIDFQDDDQIQKIKRISGIFDNFDNENGSENTSKKECFKNYLENLNLPKYSFGIWIRFKLKSPYFSKDDDEFYIIQNPIMKDYAFKVPMIRPSSWKGALARAFKEMLKEKEEINKKREIIESYLRIFGAGSEEIKTIESYLKEKSKDLGKLKEAIIKFLLFELGMELSFEDLNKIKNEIDERKLFDFLKNKVSEKLRKLKRDEIYPIEFQTHKGRLIIYPTFFDKLSLEIINPHDRRKRAGKNPVHYEVVPKGTKGILQIIYIPFDGVLKENNKLKKEVEQDLENLCEAISKLADLGIGAKTKLGWGMFDHENDFSLVFWEIENSLKEKLENLGFKVEEYNKGD